MSFGGLVVVLLAIDSDVRVFARRIAEVSPVGQGFGEQCPGLGEAGLNGGRQGGFLRRFEPGRAQFLSGFQQQGFGFQLQGLGDGPGVAAARIECGEQFRLSGFSVLRDGFVQSGVECGEGLGRLPLQQPQSGEFDVQVDVVQAEPAGASDFQAVVDGGLSGGIVAISLREMSRRGC